MPDLLTDHLNFRQATDSAVQAAQALPTEIYLETPERPGATGPPTVPPTTPAAETGAVPGPAPTPGAPPAAPPAPAAPTAQQQVATTMQGIVEASGVRTTVPRIPGDLGLASQTLQSLAAYIPTGQATPMLQQAAQGLDLLANLTLIPAKVLGADTGQHIEGLAPILNPLGLDAKKLADAAQAV